MTATTSQCRALNRRSEPCSAPAGPDGFCYFHSPARAVERLESTSAGGKARHGRRLGPPAEPARAQTTADIVAILEQAIGDCLALENSLNRARTVGYLALASLKAIELNELADRVAALELAMKARPKE